MQPTACFRNPYPSCLLAAQCYTLLAPAMPVERERARARPERESARAPCVRASERRVSESDRQEERRREEERGREREIQRERKRERKRKAERFYRHQPCRLRRRTHGRSSTRREFDCRQRDGKMGDIHIYIGIPDSGPSYKCGARAWQFQSWRSLAWPLCRRGSSGVRCR